MAELVGLAALLMFANVRLRTMRFAVAVVLVTIAAWFFGLRLLPGVVQTLRVRPSELTLETPYIQRNIQGTLAGYGLTRVRQRGVPGRPGTAGGAERHTPPHGKLPHPQ